jgi:hypothetical protein
MEEKLGYLQKWGSIGKPEIKITFSWELVLSPIKNICLN